MYEVSECWYLLKEMFFPAKPNWEKLTFTQEAWMKLMCYINLIGEFEITGFGRVVDNRIVDVKILKQTVKASTVDCDLDAMREFLMNIPKDQTGEWILDWHSHVNMGAFASGTDTANYEEQYKARMRTQYPFLIINKKQEYYARTYLSPAKQTNLEITIEANEVPEERLKEIYDECKADIENLCSKTTYTAYSKDDKKSTVFPYSNYTWGSDFGSDDYYDRWENNSNYIDVSNYKKKGLARKNVNYYEKQLNLIDDNTTEKCISCSLELSTDEELERGICDDCWEQMTPSEKTAWILNLK